MFHKLHSKQHNCNSAQISRSVVVVTAAYKLNSTASSYNSCVFSSICQFMFTLKQFQTQWSDIVIFRYIHVSLSVYSAFNIRYSKNRNLDTINRVVLLFTYICGNLDTIDVQYLLLLLWGAAYCGSNFYNDHLRSRFEIPFKEVQKTLNEEKVLNLPKNMQPFEHPVLPRFTASKCRHLKYFPLLSLSFLTPLIWKTTLKLPLVAQSIITFSMSDKKNDNQTWQLPIRTILYGLIG